MPFFLSVIIPTRDRAISLGRVLASLLRQSYPRDRFEVIIVDNGLSDKTKEVSQFYQKRLFSLRYYRDATPGLHVGRHIGMRKAGSEILVYADDDIEAFPTWLEGIAESFNDAMVVLVGGKNLPKFELQPPKWVQEMWTTKNDGSRLLSYLSILDFGDQKKEISPCHVFGCNFSIRRKVLLEAGGFHPDAMPNEFTLYRGDGESHVSRYVQHAGYKAFYHPKASVYHTVPAERMTREYFCSRAFKQGISDSYSNARHKNIMLKIKSAVKLAKHRCHCVLHQNLCGELNRAYVDGYIFHKNSMKEDINLCEWVKRVNYIDNASFQKR